MLYIRVELWPRGDRSRSKVLGEAVIANVGGTATVGNYAANLSRRGGFKARKEDDGTFRVTLPRSSSIWKQTTVEGFKRRRFGPWDLLYRVLKSVVGDRNA